MQRVVAICLFVLIGSLATGASYAQHQQGQVDLMVPSVGALLPIANVLDDGALQSNLPSGQHEASVVFGSRLTYWFISEMGVELEVLFAPSALETPPLGVPGTVDAQFFALNGRLVYDFGVSASRPGFLLTGGLGLWATNYTDYDMTTGAMGIVGVGFRLPLDNALSLRVDLSDYMTTIDWERPSGGETDKILQHDLSLSVGLVITLNKK